jgi:hypothetical protein
MDTPDIPPALRDETALAMGRISDAAEVLRLASELRSARAAVAAEADVRLAVHAARDLGISWQSIGGALGVRTEAAHERFSRKSSRG